MKKIILSLFLVVLSSFTLFAQAPEMLNYQGVARNLSGNVLPSQSIGLQIKLHSGSGAGPVVYSETFAASTNAFGLFNVQIGTGSNQTGTFSTLDWASNSYFVEVLMDETGGTAYISMGNQQLISVPYALYAKTSGNINGTLNYVPKFTPNGTTLGNSQLFDNGTNIGIGTTSPAKKIDLFTSTSSADMRLKSSSDFAAIYLDNPDNATRGSFTAYREANSDRFITGTYGSDDYRIIDWTNGGVANNAFVIKPSTNNVGIGTASPANKFSVVGRADFSDRVGIGTTTPSYPLDVSFPVFTSARIGGSSANGGGCLRIDRLSTMANNYVAFTTADAFSWTIGSVNTGGNENFNLMNWDGGSGHSVLEVEASNNRIVVNPGYSSLYFSALLNVGNENGNACSFSTSRNNYNALEAWVESTSGSNSFALSGICTPDRGLAGYFLGNVEVTGAFSVGGAKSFRIDHPLDPANKYLYHSSVESDYMMNLYNGVATTDANGVVTVQLPDWFAAVNKNFRYQLTCINEFAQAIISKEVSENEFTIKTDKPNVKVSWQVTGERNDKNADYYRMKVEEEKNTEEKGYYQNPEAFGLISEMGTFFHRRAEQQKEQQADVKNKQTAPKKVSSGNEDPAK